MRPKRALLVGKREAVVLDAAVALERMLLRVARLRMQREVAATLLVVAPLGVAAESVRLQLAQAGLSHLLQNVLEECVRVRHELGFPILITPFAQFVGTQAVLNVVQGERYRTE